jgi:hypothetical protein
VDFIDPYLTHEVLLHPAKVHVCCALSARIVGPVFNETIHCERYVQVILGILIPQLTEQNKLSGWFLQDSVTAHTARMSTQAIPIVFGDRIVGSVVWPARSSHLIPRNFSL